MGIENFNNDSNRPETARPRVSSDTHVMIKQFSKRSGKGVRESYDEIIQTVLGNDKLIHDVLASNSLTPEEFTEKHSEALEGYVSLIKEKERMPTRDEVNESEECFGFPVYIMLFGSYDGILDAIDEKYNDVSSLLGGLD